MKIQSSARINRQYIIFNTSSKKEIEKILLDYLGILGLSKVSPVFIKSKEDKVILAVNREEVNNVRAAIELANSNIKILNVSGTLKSLKSKARCATTA